MQHNEDFSIDGGAEVGSDEKRSEYLRHLRIVESAYQNTIDQLLSELTLANENCEKKLKKQEAAFIELLRGINASVEVVEEQISEGYNFQNVSEIKNSYRYRIGDKVVETAKNPLKLFLWPVWIFKLLRSLSKRKKQLTK